MDSSNTNNQNQPIKPIFSENQFESPSIFNPNLPKNDQIKANNPQLYQIKKPNNSFPTQNKSRRRTKIIATILGILILLGGLGSGLILTKQSQEIREKATKPDDKCDDVIQWCNDDGTCQRGKTCLGCCRGKPNSTSAPTSPQRPSLCQSATVDKKNIKPGEVINISSKSKEDANYFIYTVYNMDNLYPPPPDNNPKPVCVKQGGDITIYQDICPPGSHLLAFQDPDTSSRKEGSRTIRYEDLFVKDELTGKVVSNLSISAYFQREGEPISLIEPQCVVRTISKVEETLDVECSNVKAYRVEGDNWQELDNTSLSSLKAGDIVYFTVTGTSTDNGKFTKAKFKVNNENEVEVLAPTNLRPSTNNNQVEFFYRYTIPKNTNSFIVRAAMYYSGIGWIGTTSE